MNLVAIFGFFVLTIFQINCTQKLYTFNPDHCEVLNVNHSFFHFFEAKCIKRSRMELILNANFSPKVDVSSDRIAQIKITGYQFRSNEYRMGPIEFMLGVCSGLSSDQFDIPHMFSNSNMRCPIIKRHKYYVFNLSPNATNFPPLIPEGKWMLKLDFLYMNRDLIGTIQWYLAIEYKFPIP